MESHAVDRKDLHDMQAFIGSGLATLRFSEYLLLDVVSAAPARAWLQQALAFVWFGDRLAPQKERGAAARATQPQEAWSVAFTFRGLTRLGIAEDEGAPFPSQFRSGHAEETRRRLLREDPALAWRWGDVPVPTRTPEPQPVSILIARVHDGERPRSNPLLGTSQLAACGLAVVRRVHGSAHSIQTTDTPDGPKTYVVEPFGFRDGMGQPRVRGLQDFRSKGRKPEPKAEVPLGEFVLGHPNIYGDPAHCPRVKLAQGKPAGQPFGRNGCYLAVQEILQDVQAFRTFELSTAASVSAHAPTTAEKMIGRRKDGTPLQEIPKSLAFDDNTFAFRTHDARGLQCPIGAHVRRANPRDSLLDSADPSAEAVHLHRLLRRGRPYASTGMVDEPAPPNGEDVREVGLFFIAAVADLSRQYEFVKRAWVGSPNFGGLCGETDPLLGRTAPRCFTIPGQPTGTQVQSVPAFTTTQGAGYFFLPGREALKRIAAGDYTTAPEAGAAPGASTPQA